MPDALLGPYLASSALALALVGVAHIWPRLARGAFVLIFAAAAVANAILVTREPSLYVAGYAPSAVPLYRAFILGFFSQHTVLLVLLIALGQFVVALLLTRRGRVFHLGVLGGTGFLVAIAPLGMGSAFPATLIMAGALLLMAYRLRQRAYMAT